MTYNLSTESTSQTISTMDTYSNITQRWKLCTFASFIGCIILIFLPSHSHNSTYFSVLDNEAVSVMPPDQSPISSMQSQQPPNFIDNSKPNDPMSTMQFSQPPDYTDDNGKQMAPLSTMQYSPPPSRNDNGKRMDPMSTMQFSQPPDYSDDNGKQMAPLSTMQYSPPPSRNDNGKRMDPMSTEQFSPPPYYINGDRKQMDSKHNMQFAQPPNDIDNGKPMEKEEECNIFDGKWVYSRKSSPPYSARRCPFLAEQVSCQKNGRPDFKYEKWSWEAKGCEIPRFNATDMLERLRGKRVIVIGDSLNKNQWESLACLLYSAIPRSRVYVDVTRSILIAKDYKCSVEFYWSPMLMKLEVNQAGRRILRLDRLSWSTSKWEGANILVFNTGHWWMHRGRFRNWDLFRYKGQLVEEMEIESAFEVAMKTWAHWIDKKVDTSKTRVFFRSISPEHKGKQWCYNKTEPIMDESYVPTIPTTITAIVERTIKNMRTPVRYLNITKLSQYRMDAHPSIYATKQGKLLVANHQMEPKSFSDCSHWCLPGLPDTWNRLLYASIVLDSSRNQLTSSGLVF